MNRTDTIGWQGEMLTGAILRRNQLNALTHHSKEDSDDPTIGVSLHGVDYRIPLPDWEVNVAGGTLFTSQIPAKNYFVEVKAKTFFGYRQQWELVTTGIDNRLVELYHRFSEEHNKKVDVWFIQIFGRAYGNGTFYEDHWAYPGIYTSDICHLYNTRNVMNGMAYWPICNGPFSLLNTMPELRSSSDTKEIAKELRRIATRDATDWPQ